MTEEMTRLARQAKTAAHELAKLTTEQKNACLRAMADALEQSQDAIKRANALDMAAGKESSLSAAMLDRLKLDEKRIAGMAQGIREVAALPDPVGKILDERVRPNGLKLHKITTPIGVIVASVPPQIIMSAAPRSIILNESPIAFAEAEHAVAVAEFGPFAP